MTDKEYVESLLSQIDNLNKDNLSLKKKNSDLRKTERHLKRVIRGYKEQQKEKQHYRNGQKRGITRNG